MKQFLTGLALSVLTAPVQALPPEAQEAWREDLAVYASELEARHIDLHHTLPEAIFQARLDAIIAELPELTEPQLIAQLMTLHHELGDGHTAIPLWGYGYDRFPITAMFIGDQLLITGLREQDSEFLGGLVQQVNGLSVDELLSRLAPIAPFAENEGSLRVRSSAYFPVAPLLEAIGASDTSETLTLTVQTASGERDTLVLPARPAEEYGPSLQATLSARESLDPDAVLAQARGLSFVYDADHALGLIRFDRYPQAPEMDQFAAEVVSHMRSLEGRNLVIDLRENYGGDFYTGLRLAHQLNLLDELDWREGVYVLTSPLTYSAAMSNAAQFSDILNARRVGEPTGATPCGYQDMGQFSLPNSGLGVTYSKRQFCFAEPVEDALAPDVLIPVTVDQWRNDEDAVLDWVRSDIQSRQNAD
ncbi:hypothetical protein ABWI01_13690 [Oceanicaulis alexandrii]|uniref:hypothetical protein n=1 Tax=Oceanicaulis alexandrii TaxID=153233 RepID=UPI0035CF0FEC